MSTRRLVKYALAVLALLALALFPVFGGIYLLRVFFLLVAFIVLAESYDIFSGYTGYYNLGHASFFALGGYAFAILTLDLDLPIPAAIVAGAGLATAFAAGMAFPFFRLRGAYFAIATLGLVVLLFHFTNNLDFLTGGFGGRSIPIPSSVVAAPAYYAALGLAVVTTMVHYRISKGKLGLALVSIREDETIAENFGINAFRAKLKALVLSAFLAGLMGAIFVLNIGFVNPTSILSLEIALTPVVMAILGGSGTVGGPIVGATILIAVQEIISAQTNYFRLVSLGVILIAVGILLPAGLLRSRIVSRLTRVLG